MKHRLKIAEQWFEVEVGDLRTQPVMAWVNGEPIEVWIETGGVIHAQTAKAPTASPGDSGMASSTRGRGTANTDSKSVQGQQKIPVLAPIPGVIVSIAVAVGDEVTPGQELCILEAMKMKNTLRASSAGQITSVLIAVGQTVKYHEPLLEIES